MAVKFDGSDFVCEVSFWVENELQM